MTAAGRSFRLRLLLTLAIVAILAVAVGSASALVRPGESPGGSNLPFRESVELAPGVRETTTVIVQNNSAEAATIVMDFHTPAGVHIPLATQTHENVPAWGARTFEQAFNQGLLPGFRGVGVITSSQPLNAVLLREALRPRAEGGEARSFAIQHAAAEGGLRVLLPYVANQLAGEVEGDLVNTRIAMANAGTETACVVITYTPIAGRGATPPVGSAAIVESGASDAACPAGGLAIAPSGQITVGPDAGGAAVAMPAGTVNTLMSVAIDSTQPLTVTADIYRGSAEAAHLASYNGFVVGEEDAVEDDVSTEMVMPLVQKSVDGYSTEFALANPWDEAVRGMIVYTGTVKGNRTQTYRLEVNYELPAGGGFTQSVHQFGAGTFPEGFTGSAVIESDRPVAALLLRSRTVEAGATRTPFAAANGVPAERATTSAKFPLIYRGVGAGAGKRGTHSWVSVAVVGGGEATVSLVAVNDPQPGVAGCEVPALYQTTLTITDSFLFDQSSDNPLKNGLHATPDCLKGGMAISSDRPIVALGAVSSDLQAGDGEGLYNAFP